jgi:hypothetical protein
LVGSGYDFDLINDDVLQNHCQFDGGSVRVRNLDYKVLILPNIEALPLASLRPIRQFVEQGGVVIALERIPEFSTGFTDYRDRDRLLNRRSRREQSMQECRMSKSE